MGEELILPEVIILSLTVHLLHLPEIFQRYIDIGKVIMFGLVFLVEHHGDCESFLLEDFD